MQLPFAACSIRTVIAGRSGALTNLSKRKRTFRSANEPLERANLRFETEKRPRRNTHNNYPDEPSKQTITDKKLRTMPEGASDDLPYMETTPEMNDFIPDEPPGQVNAFPARPNGRPGAPSDGGYRPPNRFDNWRARTARNSNFPRSYQPRPGIPHRPGSRPGLPNLDLQTYEFNGNTFQGPPIPSLNAPQSHRSLAFDRTVSRITDTQALYTTKVGALESRFSFPLARQRTNGIINVIDTDLLQARTSTIFNISDTRVLNRHGGPIPLPLGLPVQQTQIDFIETNAVYVAFDLEVDPKRIDTLCTGPKEFFAAAFRIPRDANRSTVPLEHLLHAYNYIDYARDHDIELSWDTLLSVEPSRVAGGNARVSKKHIKDAYDQMKNRAYFNVVVDQLRAEYVGKAAPSDISSKLRRIRQWMPSPSGGPPTKLSVVEYAKAYADVVDMFDHDVPFPFNIVEGLFMGFDQHIKKDLEANGYVPATQYTTNANQLTGLQKLRDDAVLAENRVKATASIAASAISRTNATQAHTYVTQPNPPNDPSNEFPPDLPPGLTSTYYNTPTVHYSNPTFDPLDATDPFSLNHSPPETHGEQYAVHLSVAEQALRTANGGPPDPMKCFGCEDIFPDDCFHNFRECKRRNDPRVHGAAIPKIQRMIEFQ